jgi:phytoene desaturase
LPKSIVIVGAGQGGLSAAIHARLGGADVLVLEQRPVPGGKAAGVLESGYRLDPGPSIIILKRIYEAVFRAAGRRPEDYLKFQQLDPISRVCFRGETIDLPAERTACETLVDQIDPHDGRSFRALMRKLDAVSPHIDRSVFDHPYHRSSQLMDPHLIATALRFDVRKTYRELVDGMFRSPLLRAFFYGFPSYGGQSYDQKAPGALMIPYLMIQEGVYYPEGGVAAIPDSFRRLAVELGVEFRYSASVVGVEQSGRRLTGVRLEGGELIQAETVIANVDRLTAGRWLGRVSEATPSLSYFTVHWGVRYQFAQAAHHVLIVPDEFEAGFDELYRKQEFPAKPIVYLNVTSEIDPNTAPEGCSNLFAVVTSPSLVPTVDWAHVGPKVVSVRNALASAGFGFRDADIDFERIQSPQTFATRDGNYRGSLYGPDESGRIFGGLFPLRVIDEEIDNLFYCGGSVQPGAGLPMVTLSGKFAARLALAG